ncbi:hypothetical protein IEQ34_017285 [Dendrobium chrysotoxum]|uniref:Serine-rich protein-like protein n=1 Tax=Dendrobium chrysotoxum TaxID=161865 RepID=A0AAV7G9R0_DENCH|nr:hypothetical protein IEQ34_017285 [Dendrobium chrysotoxum]
MAATSRTRSSGLSLHGSGGFAYPISPSTRFFSADRVGGCGRYSSPTTGTSAFASSSTSAFAVSPTSAFSSRSTDFFHQRSASPTRVNLVGSSSGRSVDPIAAKRGPISSAAALRKTCMCSPTTHPGSFRCSLHKGSSSSRRPHAASSPSNRLNARRSAMTNSLVRIGAVEGEWVKRALTALIRPSSHQQRRRASFHPQPSRLSVMLKADDVCSEVEDSLI